VLQASNTSLLSAANVLPVFNLAIMMPMSAKASGKRSSIVVPCLLGLTVVYQLAFQFIVWQKALPEADERESPVLCWGAHKEQQANHKANAGQQCPEIEIFESWQTFGNEKELQREEDDDWLSNTPDLISIDPSGHIQLRELENHGFGVGTSTPLQTRAVDAKAGIDIAQPFPEDNSQQVDKAMGNASPKSQTEDTSKLEHSLEKDGFHLDHLKAAGFSSIHVPKLEQNLAMEGFHLDHLKAAGFSSVNFHGATPKQWSTDIQALQKRLHHGMKHLKDLEQDIRQLHESRHNSSSERTPSNHTEKHELLSKSSLFKRSCAQITPGKDIQNAIHCSVLRKRTRLQSRFWSWAKWEGSHTKGSSGILQIPPNLLPSWIPKLPRSLPPMKPMQWFAAPNG